MKIERLDSETAQITIKDADLKWFVNLMGLMSTSTLDDSEFSKFISFKRKMREHLNPLEVARSKVLTDKPVNNPSSVAEFPTMDEWLVHNRNRHEQYDVGTITNCKACLYKQAEGSTAL